jgi:DNA adenine methylase
MTIVPPVKCQGIKTKLVPDIRRLLDWDGNGRWIEPFCGSAVVAFSVQARRALLADSNVHIVRLYQAVQSGEVTPANVRVHLEREGGDLAANGEQHYYAVRERFNLDPNPWDFLFLSRACFNGVMRFNRSGRFNVPFCRKPLRFSPAYVSKIANQVRAVAKILSAVNWEFRVADFRETLDTVTSADFVYADPPYGGRHTDYYNGWDEQADRDLLEKLEELPCRFILSTWHHNRYRSNPLLESLAGLPRFTLSLVEHFYHVGPSEDLRAPMTEALVTNYAPPLSLAPLRQRAQTSLAL